MSVDTIGRVVALYRRTALTRSAIVLLAANLIPLVGVLFFGWSLLTILVLYWLENGIVGFWNVPKIVLAQGSTAAASAVPPAAASAVPPAAASAVPRFNAVGRTGLATFFLFHYGVFWVVHGIFVFALPTFGAMAIDTSSIRCIPVDPRFPGYEACEAAGPFGDVVWSSVLIAGIALFISHGASFFLNYLGRGEYLTASAGGQMAGAYGRVVVLHLTIIFGAFVVAFLGAPIGALIVLVALKTAFDLGLHLRERNRADARVPPATAFGRVVRAFEPASATAPPPTAPPTPPA
jgi:hypothetical protein